MPGKEDPANIAVKGKAESNPTCMQKVCHRTRGFASHQNVNSSGPERPHL